MQSDPLPTNIAAGTLVVLIGAAGSGKSTWAATQFCEGDIVSTDTLRSLVGEGEADQRANREMFALLDQIVEARVKRHLTTVIDSTALEPDRRAKYIALARHSNIAVLAIVLRATVKTCIERNAQRQRRVPQDIIRTHVSIVSGLRKDDLLAEGFDSVIEIEVATAKVQPTVRVVAPAFMSSGIPREMKRPLSVELAISRFNWVGGASMLRQQLADIAKEAEQMGVGGIWLMDHYRQIPQVGHEWEDLPELISSLGFLAGITSKIRLGTLVASVSARNIPQLARSMATLDVLSGGRMVCGVGAGWFEAEATEVGQRFPSVNERFELLEDALQALPLFWGKGSPSFQGRHLNVAKAMAYPRPVQPLLPLLVGGSGKRTLRLAARYANAVNLQGSAEQVAQYLAYLGQQLLIAGRPQGCIEVTHLGPMLVGDDDQDVTAQVTAHRGRTGDQRYRANVNAGTVDDQIRRLSNLSEIGVQTAIVSLVDVAEPGAIARLGQVIAKLNRP